MDVLPEELPKWLPPSRAICSLTRSHRIYRMSPAEDKELKKQMEEDTADRWIEPARSAFGAGVLFAKKRWWNAVLHCLPQTQRDTEGSVSDSPHRPKGRPSRIDEDGSPKRLPSNPCRPRTSRTHGVSDPLRFIPVSSYAIWIPRTMNMIYRPRVLPSLHRRYIDVHLRTQVEHERHLTLVLERLRKENFYAKKSKRIFATDKILWIHCLG